jgi:hypothetical protein
MLKQLFVRSVQKIVFTLMVNSKLRSAMFVMVARRIACISDQKLAVVATCDRSGIKAFKVPTRGRISKKDLEKVLKRKLDKAYLLCSDAHRSYGAFPKANTIPHKKSNTSKGQRSVNKRHQV